MGMAGQNRNDPKLLKTRGEVEAQLELRLEQGRQILALPLRSREDLGNAESEYFKWDSFNKRLLETLFTCDSVAQSYFEGPYGRSTSLFWSPAQLLEEDIRVHRLDVEFRIRRLERIKNELSLYEEAGMTGSLGQDNGGTDPSPKGAPKLGEDLQAERETLRNHKNANHPSSRRKRVASGVIVAALITAAATLIVAWLQRRSWPQDEKRFVGKVISDDALGRGIPGAKVSLEIEGIPPVTYTDSEGIFSSSSTT
jgi:hypothetical protein